MIDCNPVTLKKSSGMLGIFIFQIGLMLLSCEFSLLLRCKCKLYIIVINAIYILKGHYPVLMNKNTRPKLIHYYETYNS